MTLAAYPTTFELSDRDLSVIARIVYQQCGINLHAGKRALVSARLQRRLRQGGFRSFRQYLRYLQDDESGRELTAMLDAIATNHTAFFREARHFEFLVKTVLPPLAARSAPVRVWSAACATGEEPYSIAMTLLDRLGTLAHGRAQVLASDLSTRALAVATAGAYPIGRLVDLPAGYGERYFDRARDPAGPALVSAAVRRLVEFRQLNLLHPADGLPPQDVIFCRNVLIYFDAETQQRVIDSLQQRLARGGYLFVSHSESLSRIVHGLTWVAPAVYRKGPV